MPTVNFILGKRESEVISKRNPSRPIAHWEGDSTIQTHLTTYYANAKIFSYRTERDDTQAVGKLYKGTIDD